MSDTNDDITPDPDEPVEDDGTQEHRVPSDLIDLAVALEAHEAGLI